MHRPEVKMSRRSLGAPPRSLALLSALPERAGDQDRLPTIPGVVPGQLNRPSGCLFNPRCRYATDLCKAEVPLLRPVTPEGHEAACHHAEQLELNPMDSRTRLEIN